MAADAEADGGSRLRELADDFVQSLREDALGADWRQEAVPTNSDVSPQVGDLWITGGSRSAPPTLLAITWVGSNAYRAVVVIDEPELATAEDLLIPEEQSPIGIPLALCLWRDLPVSRLDLRQRLGQLPAAHLEPIAMLLQQKLTGGFRRRAVGTRRLSSGESALVWSLGPSDKSASAEYLTGAMILTEKDPRWSVRSAITEYSAYLERNALEEIGIDNADESLQNPAEWWNHLDLGRFLPGIQPLPWHICPGFRNQATAFAASPSREFIIPISTNERVEVSISADGQGDVRTMTSGHTRLFLFVASQRPDRVVPIGLPGDDPDEFLRLRNDTRVVFSCELASDSIDDLQVAVVIVG